MLSCEPGLLLRAIELLLGGGDVAEVRERRLTDIDLALARHLCDRLVGQLSLIWNDMAEIELGVVGLEATWRPRRWCRCPSPPSR